MSGEKIDTNDNHKNAEEKHDQNGDDKEEDCPRFATSRDENVGSSATVEEEDEKDVLFYREEEMPLFKYARLVGTLPRLLQHCDWGGAAGGKGVLGAGEEDSGGVGGGETLGACPPLSGKPTTRTNSNRTKTTHRTIPSHFRTRCTASCFGRRGRFHISALGYADGTIHLVNPLTGLDLADPDLLQVCPQGGHATRVVRINAISGISMDASGACLAACQRNGNVCLWELKFGGDALSTRRDMNFGADGVDASAVETATDAVRGWQQHQPKLQQQPIQTPKPLPQAPPSVQTTTPSAPSANATSTVESAAASFWNFASTTAASVAGGGGGVGTVSASKASVVTNTTPQTPTTSGPSAGGTTRRTGTKLSSDDYEGIGGNIANRRSSYAEACSHTTHHSADEDDILTECQLATQAMLTKYGPRIVAPPVAILRFSYGLSSTPTCLALDPACSRAKDKQIIAGFADGRVVLTKKGGFWNRRFDVQLYPGGSGVGGVQTGVSSAGGGGAASVGGAGLGGGIDAVSWRGNLVAWADVSGVKLYDIALEQNLATVKRPTGARASLYHPSVGGIRCKMCWESPSHLLMVWGDCLTGLTVRETTMTATVGATSTTVAASGVGAVDGAAETIGPGSELTTTRTSIATGNVASAAALGTPHSSSSRVAATTTGTAATSGPAAPGGIHKRTVEFTMAWQLDCVACGVAPLDSDHVVVLGVIPPSMEEEEDEYQEYKDEERKQSLPRATAAAGAAEISPAIELQVIARRNGGIISSDVLPLIRPDKGDGFLSSASKLSSSAVGRGGGVLVDTGSALAAACEYNLLSSYDVPRMTDRIEVEDRYVAQQHGALPSQTWDYATDGDKREMYQRWSIDRVLCNNYFDDRKRRINSGSGGGDISGEESELQLRKGHRNDEKNNNNNLPLPIPPFMMVISPFDAVCVSTRDADDAVQHARRRGDSKVALIRGYLNRRLLRTTSVEQLAQEYLMSLLCSNSLSGLQLAAKSCPALLMGNLDMWERWTCLFAKVPAGLFALREYVPVRDPKLSAPFYEMMLEKMLIDVETMYSESEKKAVSSASSSHFSRENTIASQAKELYLNALRGWGPTRAMKERILLLKYRSLSLDGGTTYRCNTWSLRQLQSDLNLRMYESASQHFAREDDVIDLLCLGDDDTTSMATAAVVDDHGGLDDGVDLDDSHNTRRYHAEKGERKKMDSLYSMSNVARRLAPRMSLNRNYSSSTSPSGSGAGNDNGGETNTDKSKGDSSSFAFPSFSWRSNFAIAAEAMAELNFMRGDYAECLRMYLILGANQANASSSSRSTHSLDEIALSSVFRRRSKVGCRGGGVGVHGNVIGGGGGGGDGVGRVLQEEQAYQHVLAMIEHFHLHHYLLDEEFVPTAAVAYESDDDNVDARGRDTLLSSPLPSSRKQRPAASVLKKEEEEGEKTDSHYNLPLSVVPPIVALIQLVGLELCGRFLVDNCVPNASSSPPPGSGKNGIGGGGGSAPSSKIDAPMPMHMVASQLAAGDGGNGTSGSGSGSARPRSRPKLLLWYLDILFTYRADVYVNFPNTAVVPPREITELHRQHLELLISYGGRGRGFDSRERERDNEHEGEGSCGEAGTSSSSSSLLMPKDSLLMAFLRLALPHGGAKPDYARRLLEEARRDSILDGGIGSVGGGGGGRHHRHHHRYHRRHRRVDDDRIHNSGSGGGGAGRSGHGGTVTPPFARELAFVIEKSGKSSEHEKDAKLVLKLLLEEAESLHLAVQYAERNTTFSEILWELLVTHCLNVDRRAKKRKKQRAAAAAGLDGRLGDGTGVGSGADGSGGGPLFGSLLQAAAMCGADLAHLVSQIPRGMKIKGLRPMLVAAVADYRLGVQMHEFATNVSYVDKVAILRESAHKSRRAKRVQYISLPLLKKESDFLRREKKGAHPKGAMTMASTNIVPREPEDFVVAHDMTLDSLQENRRRRLRTTKNRSLAHRLYRYRQATAMPGR